MDHTLVIDILFLFVCGVAAACGFYAIQGHQYSLIRALLWLIAMQVGIWALGHALSHVSMRPEVQEVGRILTLLGISLLFGLVVHFLLLIIHKDTPRRRKRLYPLIYLPGLATFPVSVLSPNSYALLFIYGEKEVVFSGWNILGPAYVVSYLLWIGALLLKAKKYALFGLISGSVFLNIPIGLLQSRLPFETPPLSVVLAVIPLMALCREFRKAVDSSVQHSDAGLKEAAPPLVYRWIGLAFVVAVLLDVIMRSRQNFLTDRLLLITYCAVMLVAGLIIGSLPVLKISERLREWVLVVIISALIPTFMLRFATSGGITVWAFSFLPLILGLLFRRRMLAAALVTSSLLSQGILWARYPSLVVRIDGLDYGLRVVILAAAAVLVFYVHSIYIKRLRESTGQIHMHKLIADVSHEFVTAGEENFEDKLEFTLERTARFIQCSKAYIAFFEPDGVHVKFSCKWLEPGLPYRPKEIERTFEGLKAFLLSQFQTEGVVTLMDAMRMYFQSPRIKKHLLAQNIRGLIALPIIEQGKVIGLMGFCDSKPVREWNVESTVFLEALAQLVADVAAKVEEEKRMNYLAYHDPLTHLPTRGYFNRKLEETIETATRERRMFGIVFIDLDLFKTINDTMGHEWGDQLLCHVAEILSQNVREGDTVARMGGDEFVLLLDPLRDSSEAVRIMEKIFAAARNPLTSETQATMVTLSAGVALFPRHGNDALELLKNADKAMYQAKRQGRNHFAVYSEI